MHNLCADHERIREIMVRFGEILDIQGYPKVLEDIEGHGAIGQAVSDPRDFKALKKIDAFMRDIRKELAEEPPSQEKANALAAHTAAVQGIRACIREV